MWQGLAFLPEQASTIAGKVDALFWFLVAVSAVFAGLIFVLVAVFAIRYRRRDEAERPRPILGSLPLELLWTGIPLLLGLVIFAWGAALYFTMVTPPANSLEIYAVGKQWMWKFQHPGGQREINELHVPLGRPIKLTMTSEDVIHSFFVPAFRVKNDVLPGKYTTAWFEATRPGEYHLFCAEYCGTSHALMGGRVVVMEPAAYERWLSGSAPAETLAEAGEKLFTRLGCSACHQAQGTGRGPSLQGVYGSPVKLAGGGSVPADETYLRESILNPQAKLVAGFPPIMPTFKGIVTEEGLTQILAYLKTLRGAPPAKAQP